MYLIIPSAKIVPKELQNLGKLPAVIYPVNQRIVFDYLYEEYKDEVDQIKVECYENASKVHRRLEKYKSDKVIVENLQRLGDLGFTLYIATKGMKGAGIINFADTIVMDKALDVLDGFYYAVDDISDTWTFFEEENGEIKKILDKKATTGDKGKLFVGVFYFSHIEVLNSCLEEALKVEDRGMNSFYYALLHYSHRYSLTPVLALNWLDIGHADRYFNSQIEVKAREFNHIRIDKDRGILTKTSDDVDKFIGEIKWYLKLPADVEYVRPRIFNYSLAYTEPYVSMEYYSYHTVHELFLYGDLTKSQWTDIFKRIRFVCQDFMRYSVKDNRIKPALEDMYLKKTLQRFDKLRKNDKFGAFFEKSITINGRRYKPLNLVAKVLNECIPILLYDVDTFHIIHGDLCFANIMVDSNFSFIKVIDPRGKFGSFDIYGDTRYELAKLFHSVDGKYDFIIKDLFTLDYDLDAAKIEYSINDRVRDYDLYKLFVDVFNDEIGADINKIELIEALLFLSMIPLHGESINHQLVMLGTGLDILNRVVDITV